MSRAPKHRQAIIDAAVDLFRRQGYAGTGLNDIVKASGAPKGSLYHYFPDGKASIAEAAVLEAGHRVAQTVQDVADRSASTGELLIGHATLLAGWMKESGYRDGSPATTVLLEMAPDDRAVTLAGREISAAWRNVLTEKLIADGVPARRAPRLAILCVAALDGALVQARVQQSGDPIMTAAEELQSLLAAII